MITKKKFNISIMFFCLFFTIITGCGKPFYKSQSESEKRKQENEAAREYFEERLAEKAMELQLEIEKAEKELTKCREILAKKTSKKASLEKRIKEIEVQMKAYKDKIDEITKQIEIFEAVHR